MLLNIHAHSRCARTLSQMKWIGEVKVLSYTHICFIAFRWVILSSESEQNL